MKQFRWILSLVVLVFSLVGASGCSRSHGKVYKVGVDPSWFGLELMGKEANVYAFASELLTEISKESGVDLARINMSWDNLTDGLRRGEYQAILASFNPTVIAEKSFSFSEIALETGPVLVVGKKSMRDSLGDFKGDVVSIGRSPDEILLLAEHPDVMMEFYGGIRSALTDVKSDRVQGTLIPLIPAYIGVNDLFEGDLKVASKPLFDEGVRLITLKGEYPNLIKRFNDGLREVKANGTYMRLLKKWQIPSSENPSAS
ncbi:MAG: ABC transporter arginine-binding protein 1 [Chlamydiia bacterium]|nr:ABC transporter arginine-binding protein 1 [Chlamydiia bacterium]